MGQPAKAQEPSMEEILASIRRIIADDDNNKPEPEAAAPPAMAAEPPPPPLPVAAPVPEPMPEPEVTQSDVDSVIAELSAPRADEEPEAESDGVLELTESMAALPPEDSPFQTIDGQSDVMFSDAPADPPSRPVEERPQSFRPSSSQERTLLSDSTTSAVNSAFNTLAQTVLVHNARTLEDLVREMLRPMLKSWLDDNLPSMVERIVRAEIERVSRGRN